MKFLTALTAVRAYFFAPNLMFDLDRLKIYPTYPLACPQCLHNTETRRALLLDHRHQYR